MGLGVRLRRRNDESIDREDEVDQEGREEKVDQEGRQESDQETFGAGGQSKDIDDNAQPQSDGQKVRQKGVSQNRHQESRDQEDRRKKVSDQKSGGG